jgi:transcriptional regulator with XRE-family HTH domain
VNDQERRVALRAFLGECRARIKPEDAGLRLPGRRRVPGLRREEVAQLAGVSAAWYALLETARDIRVSPRMLDRVASALQLAADEKLYLFSLAIAEMPTIPRCDIAGSGAVGTEYAELTRFAKQARSVPTPSELEELTTELLFELARHPEVAYFVRADLDSSEFWFSAQQVSPHVPFTVSSNHFIRRGNVRTDRELRDQQNATSIPRPFRSATRRARHRARQSRLRAARGL